MKRERNLQECLISVSAGAVIAIMLCAVLPGITTKLDFVAFFAMFWLIATYCVWSVIDWRDAKRPPQLGDLKRR